jgi:NO-binding membrane sensor protein with MHYT domain
MGSNGASTAMDQLTTIDDDWEPRYGLVLVLVSLTFICLSTLPSTVLALAISVVLQATTLIVTLRTSRARPAIMNVGLFGTAIAVALGIALLIVTETGEVVFEARGGTFLITVLLAVLSIPVIAVGVVRHIQHRRAVSLQALAGAVCIYLLFGILFALAYGAVAAIGDNAFFTDGTDGDNRTHIYFSFVTLTTLGYGDFAPALEVGRTLATVEALVTIIGVLVGNLGQRRSD